ncbi:hypothetical protein KP509_05G086600 [Ceratopteris richardii]|uniref:Uncharacterized protein n=1 Tax=Ceratopteris richardii TaxID=49495 RepID=A0A8T2USL4_CERRI|nr:hypothetical protein KP509_05G086600 [Ceratopteris richardii]
MVCESVLLRGPPGWFLAFGQEDSARRKTHPNVDDCGAPRYPSLQTRPTIPPNLGVMPGPPPDLGGATYLAAPLGMPTPFLVFKIQSKGSCSLAIISHEHATTKQHFFFQQIL